MGPRCADVSLNFDNMRVPRENTRRRTPGSSMPASLDNGASASRAGDRIARARSSNR